MKWFFAAIIILGLIGYCAGAFEYVTPERIRLFVLSFGWLAPLVFIILFSLAPLAPFFSAVLAIAGGLIFGFWVGSLLIMIGALCGSTVGFYIARYSSRLLKQLPRRKQVDQEKMQQLQNRMTQNGFFVVLVLRLIPLIPFDLLSYAAGFSRIRYRDFFFATFLGMIPGVLVYANIGANTLQINSTGFYVSIALLIALTVFALLLKQWIQKKFTF